MNSKSLTLYLRDSCPQLTLWTGWKCAFRTNGVEVVFAKVNRPHFIQIEHHSPLSTAMFLAAPRQDRINLITVQFKTPHQWLILTNFDSNSTLVKIFCGDRYRYNSRQARFTTGGIRKNVSNPKRSADRRR